SLIRKDAVFARSLNSSGVVASTIAGWKDWPRLVEVCFDNREADIGRFLRRHISDASGKALREFLSAFESARQSRRKPRTRKTKRRGPAAKTPSHQPAPPLEIPVLVKAKVPQIDERLNGILDAGLQRFHVVVAERGVTLPPHGSWEIAAVVRDV